MDDEKHADELLREAAVLLWKFVWMVDLEPSPFRERLLEETRRAVLARRDILAVLREENPREEPWINDY